MSCGEALLGFAAQLRQEYEPGWSRSAPANWICRTCARSACHPPLGQCSGCDPHAGEALSEGRTVVLAQKAVIPVRRAEATRIPRVSCGEQCVDGSRHDRRSHRARPRPRRSPQNCRRPETPDCASHCEVLALRIPPMTRSCPINPSQRSTHLCLFRSHALQPVVVTIDHGDHVDWPDGSIHQGGDAVGGGRAFEPAMGLMVGGWQVGLVFRLRYGRDFRDGARFLTPGGTRPMGRSRSTGS